MRLGGRPEEDFALEEVFFLELKLKDWNGERKRKRRKRIK